MNLLISPIRFENLHRSIPKLATPRKSTVSKTDNPFPPRQWIACWICNEVKIPLLAVPERGAEKLRVENRGRKKRRRRKTISISLLFDYQMVDSFQRGIGQARASCPKDISSSRDRDTKQTSVPLSFLSSLLTLPILVPSARYASMFN